MTENKFLGINTLNYIRKLLRSQNRWLFVSWICQVAKCCREVVSQDTPAMHEIHAEMWLRLRSCPGVLLPPLCTLPCVKFIATSRQTLSWEGAKLGVLEANLWGPSDKLQVCGSLACSPPIPGSCSGVTICEHTSSFPCQIANSRQSVPTCYNFATFSAVA